MGCCDSRTSHEKQVDAEIVGDKRKDELLFKLLFLGSGDSGKSTIFKQLRKIHGKGYDDVYRRSFIHPIYTQVYSEMQHAMELVDEFEHLSMSDTPETKRNIELCGNAQKLNASVADAVKYLWLNEPVIKQVCNMKTHLKLADSSPYFWDHIDRLMRSDYLPTDEDLVLVRNPTTGLYEQTINIQGYDFLIVDVGGQRNERKKWIHQFSNVTAVIFIASLSCFDAVLYEDENVNAMEEQLKLFDRICNNEHFVNTAMILLLNKTDLFREKIQALSKDEDENAANKRNDIRQVWPEYDGDCSSFEECGTFIQRQFEALNRNTTQNVFVHFSCATNTDNVKKIFNDIQHIIVNESLKDAGLIAS